MIARSSLIALLMIIMATTAAHAETEMADGMYANGKIYVVVAVLATIFAGIFAYLVYIDRKVSKAEKNIK